jgi:microcystin-dependent protein
MSNQYVGEIRIFAGNFAPEGWLTCDGTLLPISEFETLFQLIGTTYGGDGQTTFALPDLRSRVPLHQGSGLVLGQLAGEENVTLNVNQIPAHSHPAAANSGAGSQSSPSGGVWAASSANQYSSTAPAVAMSASAIRQAGGSQPHDNMPPYAVLTFIIATTGIFPSQG